MSLVAALSQPARAQAPPPPPPVEAPPAPPAEPPAPPAEPPPAETPPAPAEPPPAETPPAAPPTEVEHDEPEIAADEEEPPGDATATDDSHEAPVAAENDGFSDLLVVSDPRLTAPTASTHTLSFALHGEVQLRFRANNELPLRPPETAAPGTLTSLGQTFYFYEWVRFRPVFQYRDVLKVAGEIDFPRGIVAGETTEFVSAARDAYDELVWYELHPRALYIQYNSPIGLFRLGHQTSHWGMGLLANDGDHATIFGDYRRGSIVERLLFATKPLGKDGPLAVALAGDLVFEDGRADLIDPDDADRVGGDRALQAVAAVRLEGKAGNIGLYGVLRHQERDVTSVDEFTPFTEDLDVGVIDAAAKFHADVPGANAYVYGEAEAAAIFGSTTYIRNIILTQSGEEEEIRSFGGAVRLGAVRVREEGADRWGQVVAQIELGYASGDADPYDGVSRRFTFDENHNVGLVLFDHVLGWKTARAASIAEDPDLVARTPPGVDFLPSNGGVFGAAYLYPTVIVRPRHWLDLKAGAVIAQTTADFVDPSFVGTRGDFGNYDGGDPRAHDLGVEIDLGADARFAIGKALVLQGGVEGGVLLPGAAFEHESGEALGAQYLVNSKLGMQY